MREIKLLFTYILLIAVIASGCSSQVYTETGKPIIKIGYLPITHAGPLYIDAHLHEGKFSDYEIEMIKFGSWPDLMDALNTGRIQGASVLVELAMKAKEKGIDLKAVALGHKDGNVLITTNDITQAEDVIGKSFAIPHKYSTHNLLLNEYLKNNHLNYSDVNVVEMPPAEMPVALSEKRIAGYAVAEPFGAISVVMNNGKVLEHSEDIWPHSYCCVLVLRNDFIMNHHSETESFVKQYALSGEMAANKDEKVYESYLNFMNVKKDVLDLSLEWISYDDLMIDEKEYEKLRDRVIEMDLMENPPTYDDFVDNSFLSKVK